MAESALRYGLNDDEWDGDALLIKMMTSINAIIDYNLNPSGVNREANRPGGLDPDRPSVPDRPVVQYFHIGDGELTESGNQQEAEGRS